jgi:ethanolamine utilization protein EutP
MMLVGRSESGKTTLTQALRGEKIHYSKIQSIHYHEVIIDTPGEYAENKDLAAALAVYSYEADVIGLLISATEPNSLYPPNATGSVNREVIGIVTKVDKEDGDPLQAEAWLRLSGCETVFQVSALTGAGLDPLLAYLMKDTEIRT